MLKKVIEECKDGASARSICEIGDKMILEETSKVYKKEKEMKKGLFDSQNCMPYSLCFSQPLKIDT